ncbi:MAG: hypothetical protein J0M31_23305, partial [Candidatus Accumulibacter sp.]|nr:hypothetical protein [Accumulibacter sp.]
MDTSPTRLLIHGASGRMGQALLRLAAEQPACTVVAAVTRRAPAQRVVDGVPHFAATELGGVPAFDAAVDFSLPEGFDAVLALCVDRGCPLVSGTTGIDAAQQDALANILSTTKGTGGSPFNVLVDLALMGAKFPLEATGLVGADENGRWIVEQCAAHGIGT